MDGEDLVGEGFRLLRGALDAELVAGVRDVALHTAWRAGWVETSASTHAALTGLRFGPQDPALVAYQAAVLASASVPAIRAALAELAAGVPLGADVLRITFPSEPHGTRPHQDAAYLGRDDFVTAWVPLTACPPDRGPLEVAASSGRLLGHDGERGIVDQPNLQWWSTSFSVGDVLLFDALTVHRSQPNRSKGRIRLSLDMRFEA